MKTIRIRKSNIFSANSKVFICSGTNKIIIKGFGLYALSVNSGESVQAEHLWTRSNILGYDNIIEGSTVLIKPRLGRAFTIFVAILFIICACIFFIFKLWWSFIPLGIVALYIIAYLTLLKDKYLIIEQSGTD